MRTVIDKFSQNQIDWDCSITKPPLPPRIFSLYYKVTTYSPNLAHLFVCLRPSTETSDSVMETLRAKETYCFYCQGCMTRLLEDRWGADSRRRGGGTGSSSGNGFLFTPSSAGKGASIYWWCDPAVEVMIWERKIDGWRWSWSPQLSAWVG